MKKVPPMKNRGCAAWRYPTTEQFLRIFNEVGLAKQFLSDYVFGQFLRLFRQGIGHNDYRYVIAGV